MMKSLAELLKTARKSRKLTQRELAEQMNVSRATISNWENGNAEPDFTTICALSAVLRCDFVPRHDEIVADLQPTERKMRGIIAESSEIAIKSSSNAGKMTAGTVDLRISGSDILGNTIDFHMIAPFSLEIPVEHR